MKKELTYWFLCCTTTLLGLIVACVGITKTNMTTLLVGASLLALTAVAACLYHATEKSKQFLELWKKDGQFRKEITKNTGYLLLTLGLQIGSMFGLYHLSQTPNYQQHSSLLLYPVAAICIAFGIAALLKARRERQNLR